MILSSLFNLVRAWQNCMSDRHPWLNGGQLKLLLSIVAYDPYLVFPRPYSGKVVD